MRAVARLVCLTALVLAVDMAVAADAASADPAGMAVRTIDATQVRVLGTVMGPEGPTVLPDGSVAMVEFMPGNIVAVHPDGTREVLAHPGSGVTGTALGRDGALYVAKMNVARFMQRAGAAPSPAGTGSAAPAPPPARGDGSPAAIVRIDLKTRAMRTLYTQVDGQDLAGPNDLVVDAWGDLWLTQPAGDSVLNARADGSHIHIAIEHVKGANGITLSPDKRTVYVMDGRALTAFTITGRGMLKQQDDRPARRVVMQWPESLHEPDGLKTERSGNLLGGCWGDGVVRISPQGKVLSQTVVPGQLVINFTFAAKHPGTLFLAAHPAQSMTGGLIAIPWDAPGIP